MSFKKIPFWVTKRKTLPGKLDQSRKVVVGKFKRQRAVARQANQPPPDTTRVRYHMQLAELEALKAGAPRPRFPFTAVEVTAIHTAQHGAAGIWFRLEDGRVFNGSGEPDISDPAAYGELTTGEPTP